MSSILAPTDAALDQVARHLAEGGAAGMPTETVYGLAADARSASGVARVFALKGRPSTNPLIVHLRQDHAGLSEIAVVPEAATALIAAFVPGPLTLVLPYRGGLAEAVTADLGTVAVRAPTHPVAHRLIARHGGFLVAPSANPSGRLSPTCAADVAAAFGPDVPVLDGGRCAFGVESTIVGLTGSAPTLLRPGAIPADRIEAVLGRPLAPPPSGIAAPGMMTSHYAPASAVRLNASRAEAGEVLLGFGGTPGAALDLSPSGDLAEAAANLFASLRALDGRAPRIAVAPIPRDGLGAAINDRLARAAAPRP